VLTSGPKPPNPGEIVSSKRMSAIVTELKKEADIVLVDSPALLAVGDTAALAGKVDGVLFLIDMAVVKRPMLEEAADLLGKLPCRKLGVVVMRQHGAGSEYRYSSYYYEDVDGTRRRRSKVGART
jgi:Mrp family chromosome partitioning ATPase